MSPRLVQVLAIAVAGVLVLAASRFTPQINEGRRSLNMIGTERPEENTPPEYAFAVQAFGAFRSILTNIAFIRAEEYKQQGRYYDAMQLASWICTLQPRFPSVWEFHAWNMAWNISVTTHTPEERWNWVYNGVKLLRDQGLKFNPRAINLYKQLAWIFVNKMSETTDEYHMAYKRNWAWRMHLLLGPPPAAGTEDPEALAEAKFGELGIGSDKLLESIRLHKALTDQARAAAGKAVLPDYSPEELEAWKTRDDARALAIKARRDYLLSIADAPASLSELYAQTPAAREMVRRLADVGVRISDDELDEDAYWNESGLGMTFFRRYRQLADSPSLFMQVLKDDQRAAAQASPDEKLAAFDEIVGVTRQDPVGRELLRFLQRKVLLEVYKLDPRKMASLIETFGPMDWRVVDAHSLYWVNEGLIAAEETISSFKNDKVNTARMIFFSLRNLFHRNRLVFEPFYPDINYSYINFTPDLNFVESLHQAYITYGPMMDTNPLGAREVKGAGETFSTGHINFLTESIALLFFYGRQAEADRYYAYLQRTYGLEADGTPKRAFNKPLRDFVIDNFIDSDMSERDTRNFIAGLLIQAFDELAQGNRAGYSRNVKQAQALHFEFHHGDTPPAEKLRMPPLFDIAADVLRFYLSQPGMSPLVTLDKARLWLGLPVDLKQEVYDELSERLAQECEQWQFDVAKAFPEPPGMAEFREQRGRRGPEKKEKVLETPAQQLN